MDLGQEIGIMVIDYVLDGDNSDIYGWRQQRHLWMETTATFMGGCGQKHWHLNVGISVAMLPSPSVQLAKTRPPDESSKDPLQWRHNERDSVSNHQPHDCLLNRLFRRRSKKTSKLRVTGLCAGNSPGTAQMASYAENVSIWWRHHARRQTFAYSIKQRQCWTMVGREESWENIGRLITGSGLHCDDTSCLLECMI